MYMHPYTRLYGASVLLFKIECTLKKLKKFVTPSPGHKPGISWGADSQQILQRNKNEKCHGVCSEARAGYECEEEKESYAQNNAVFTPFMTCPLTPPNDQSEMLLNQNDDMMKMGVNALYGVVLRM